MSSPRASITEQLVDAASRPFRASGRTAYFFARGKLRGDPVFESLLVRGWLANRSNVLDLGCGQGLLAAWLRAAHHRAASEAWPQDWPPPPQLGGYRGFELARHAVEKARLALGSDAEFSVTDVRTADFGQADGIVILDVLHYIEYSDQLQILERARRALPADGVLLLRVGDVAGGWRFYLAKCVDRMVLLSSGHGLKRLYCRPVREWHELLAAIGFDTESLPMSAGTLFANFLLVARPR